MQHLAQQNLRSRLLQHAPLVAQWVTEKILLEFFASAETLAMDWQLPIEFLTWLHLQPAYRERLNEAMIKELLAGAAVRWAMQGLDHVSAKGIIIVSCYSTIAVTLQKSSEADKTHTISFMRLAQLPDANAYTLSY